MEINNLKYPIAKIENNKAKLYVKVFPKSNFNKINGFFHDSRNEAFLKVYVTDVPESGKANNRVISLLSKKFKIPKTNFSILLGNTTKIKIFEIDEVSDSKFDEIINIFSTII